MVVFSSVAQSCATFFATPWTAECQASLSITKSRSCSNSCPSSQWCHPTISSYVVPFSSCLQSFPASVSFLTSQFFASGGPSIGASASASALPMSIQDWFPFSVQFSHSVVSNSLRPHESQHARPPCPSPTPGVYPKSCPSSRWCHPAISSSAVPFTSCPQSLPASGSFPMSQLFAWGGQSVGDSASASVLSMNTQDWSPLGSTGCIFLQSKGLSRVFSNTTVQKHQFLGAQLSSQSNSHVHTWPLEKP